MSTQASNPFLRPTNQNARKQRTRVIEWLGAKMIAQHSLRARAASAVNMALAKELTVHGFVGAMGTGKTTLMRSLAHLMQREFLDEENGGHVFNILEWGEDELEDIRESLKQVTTDSIILIDDISFADRKMGSQKFAGVLSDLTKIRHREETAGRDVKVVMLFAYHYSKAINKSIRSWTDFIWCTAIQPAEFTNYDELFGPQAYRMIRIFSGEVRGALLTSHKKKGGRRWGPAPKFGPNKGKKLYEYQKPFAPALCFDGSILRTVAVPHLDKILEGERGTAPRDGRPPKEILDSLQLVHGATLKTAARYWIVRHTGEMPKGGVEAAYKALDRQAREYDITTDDVKEWLDATMRQKYKKGRDASEPDDTPDSVPDGPPEGESA